MMHTRWIRLSALAVGLALMVVGMPTVASAQGEPDQPVSGEVDEKDEEAEYKEGPSVRRKILRRSTRLELTPMLGVSTGDAFVRNVTTGAAVNYYLTNQLGIGVVGGFAPIHAETNLANNVKTELEGDEPDRLEDLQFSFLQWFAGVEFTYVPVFGKFSMMNSSTIKYDVHLLGGVSLMGRGACKAAGDGSCASRSVSGTNPEPIDSGIKPAGTLGVGFRMFLGDSYALNLQVRDHLYNKAEVGTPNSSTETFQNNMMVNLGFSIFLPQTVKVSR